MIGSKYIGVEVPRWGDGVCSDPECPCPETRIPVGTGFLWISHGLVDFRREWPILRNSRKAYAGKAIVLGAGVATPILMCEGGARLRGIDLEVAAVDAQRWWKTGFVSLRATPAAADRTGMRHRHDCPVEHALLAYRPIGDASAGIEVTVDGLNRLMTAGDVAPDRYEVRRDGSREWTPLCDCLRTACAHPMRNLLRRALKRCLHVVVASASVAVFGMTAVAVFGRDEPDRNLPPNATIAVEVGSASYAADEQRDPAEAPHEARSSRLLTGEWSQRMSAWLGRSE